MLIQIVEPHVQAIVNFVALMDYAPMNTKLLLFHHTTLQKIQGHGQGLRLTLLGQELPLLLLRIGSLLLLTSNLY